MKADRDPLLFHHVQTKLINIRVGVNFVDNDHNHICRNIAFILSHSNTKIRSMSKLFCEFQPILHVHLYSMVIVATSKMAHRALYF